ncbi:hypothetical protein [Mucilaginibacter sp.]|uniref:hypothetical protein n=1 Tax=Mucilaginibacter sp. TaxID=1882438 RepID=UPI003266FDB6
MKILYYAASILVFAILIYLLISQRKKQKPVEAKPVAGDVSENAANPYMGLRAQIFALKPSDLNLNLPADNETAFGVVIEFGTEDGTATVISLATGDASMYTSGGGGMIGGAYRDNVKKAAISFVNTSQRFFTQMRPGNTALPAIGHIKFHVLTNKGAYSFEGLEAEITAQNSEWVDLFDKANEVITQLRLISDK